VFLVPTSTWLIPLAAVLVNRQEHVESEGSRVDEN